MTRHLIKASLFAPLLLGAAILPAAAQDRPSGGMMMDGGMMGCGLFGMFIMLIGVLFLLLGIAAFIKYLRSK